MSFTDNIQDWYKIANKNGTGLTRKMDKSFNKHLIKPCQMISIIGQTGCGKSQAILEFLSRKNEAFYNLYYSLVRPQMNLYIDY